MFVAKALEYTLRRVVLLTVNRSVLLQNTVDDIREGGQFRAFRWLASPISRRFRMPQHLPHRLARNAKPTCASRWLRPSTWQASRTRRYRSTVYILPPSISKKIEGYRWQSFTPPAAGKSRRFHGLICHRRSHPADLPHFQDLGGLLDASARVAEHPTAARGSDGAVYKYVTIAGHDSPRLVQVGVPIESSLGNLLYSVYQQEADILVRSRNLQALWIVNLNRELAAAAPRGAARGR